MFDTLSRISDFPSSPAAATVVARNNLGFPRTSSFVQVLSQATVSNKGSTDGASTFASSGNQQTNPLPFMKDQAPESHSITSPQENEETKLKAVFQQFVAGTFFGLLLKEMRKSIHKTKYFHGGLAEDIFEQHLDMAVADKLAQATGDRFAEPLYELFQLQRHGSRL